LFCRGGPLPPGSWFGNHPARKFPRGEGILTAHIHTGRHTNKKIETRKKEKNKKNEKGVEEKNTKKRGDKKRRKEEWEKVQGGKGAWVLRIGVGPHANNSRST